MEDDIPENLQVIKKEDLTTQNTDKYKNTIKERLNLHVKRRQQQLSPQRLTQATTTATVSNMEKERHTTQEEKPKETTKTRRPYTKKADKAQNTTNESNNNNNSSNNSSNATTRKRNKTKHNVGGTTSANYVVSPSTQHEFHGADDEGECGAEADAKSSNVRSPDVLSMVLSAKKQALMRDPEVQEFLANMLKAIKS